MWCSFLSSDAWVCARAPDMTTSDSNLFQKPWHIRKSCKVETLQGWRKRRERLDSWDIHIIDSFWQTLWQTFTPYSDRRAQNKIDSRFTIQITIHVSNGAFHWKPLFIKLESLLEETLSLLKHRQVPLKTSYFNPWWFQFPTRFCLVRSGIKHLFLLAAWFFMSCTVRDWLFEILVFTLNPHFMYSFELSMVGIIIIFIHIFQFYFYRHKKKTIKAI